jgi:hypothetical protein
VSPRGGKQGTRLSVGDDPCHGCHRPGWRVDFITTGSVDASALFISSTASAFFMPSFMSWKEKITRHACFHGYQEEILWKVEGYKEVAACKGSYRAYHFSIQQDKEITIDIAGEIQGGRGITLSCIHAGSFHEKKMETNLDTLHPDTKLFPFGTRLCERLGVAPVEEKLVQHRLRWFGHIQRRPAEAPVRSGVIRRSGNEKRGRGRPNLTREESVKRDLKDWCITKELALDRRE